MGVMQLNAIESGLSRARGGIGENFRQHPRQFAYMAQMHVSDALAITEAQRFTLAFVENASDDVFRGIVEKMANLSFVNSEPVRIAGEFGNSRTMMPSDF